MKRDIYLEISTSSCSECCTITTDVKRVGQMSYSAHHTQPLCYSQRLLCGNILAEAEMRIIHEKKGMGLSS